eukprot:CAMPEP_0177599050 /NCGR_PEP_ID=MMETSP0419_2-20121207/12751_1 /TAXON_ID=582737 /ORGANISM="Tetraselmis sp., Strain GSL018" /LENGTH=727 /DNA_ID=CAMNT_0019091687 /DNA_START=111 /DNA_END=2294 /DNA_ORIENTATION=+
MSLCAQSQLQGICSSGRTNSRPSHQGHGVNHAHTFLSGSRLAVPVRRVSSKRCACGCPGGLIAPALVVGALELQLRRIGRAIVRLVVASALGMCLVHSLRAFQVVCALVALRDAYAVKAFRQHGEGDLLNFLREGLHRTVKVLVAAAASVAAALFPLAGQALAAAKNATPPPPPPPPAETSTPLMDSFSLVTEPGLTFGEKATLMMQEPSLALVPMIALALGIVLVWALRSASKTNQYEDDEEEEEEPLVQAAAHSVSADQLVRKTSAIREKLEAAKERAAETDVSAAARSAVSASTIVGGGGADAEAAETQPAYNGVATLVKDKPLGGSGGSDGEDAPEEAKQSTTAAAAPAEAPAAPEPTPAPATPAAAPVGALVSEGFAQQPRAVQAIQDTLMSPEVGYLAARAQMVQKHFPTAVTIDDFAYRLEMVLSAFGFAPSNSIAMVNMCRDESTNAFRTRLEEVFPIMFNINGLGAGLTCGVTGMKAGLSHAPDMGGRKRYVFFSFPHIAIDSRGNAGKISRAGQCDTSSACGAMIGALSQLKAEGLEAYTARPGSHSPSDPEYSILKQRIAGRITQERLDVSGMDLIEFTRTAERQISQDLETLIGEAVDPKEADYVIVTGVQVHNWATEFDNEEPNLEFAAPTRVSVVINGQRSEIELPNVPPLSPRQVSKLANQRASGGNTRIVSAYTGKGTVTSMGGTGMTNASQKQSDAKARNAAYEKLLNSE